MFGDIFFNLTDSVRGDKSFTAVIQFSIFLYTAVCAAFDIRVMLETKSSKGDPV